MDDFEIADAESGSLVRTKTEYVSAEIAPPSNMLEQREYLVKKYYNGHSSLAERLNAEDRNSIETMVMALVAEVLKETDNLLGNGLIAIEQGDLRDASVISAKRAEVLEKAIKAVQTKQIFDKETGIDVDSPSMRVVFRFFMKKVKFTFEKLGFDMEASDAFFRSFETIMEHWQKELRQELDDLKKV